MRVSKDAETIVLDKQVELDYSHLRGKNNRKKVTNANESQKDGFKKKRKKVDNANSYATEGIIKDNWVKDRARQKEENPGFTPGKIHCIGAVLRKAEKGEKPFSRPMYPELQKEKEHKK